MAFMLFGLGYLVATILGFPIYYIHETVMWIVIFTLMPVVFRYLFYIYLTILVLGHISRFCYLKSLKKIQIN